MNRSQDISLYQKDFLLKKINALQDQVAKMKVELSYARGLVEKEYTRLKTIENTQNRRKELEERMLKIEEAARFLVYLKEEPELLLNEINNIKTAIGKLNMLKNIVNAVKNGDISKVRRMNELQDEVNNYSETDIEVLKKNLNKLSDSYNRTMDFATKYMKNNKLTVNDYIEWKKSIQYGQEYLTISKMKLEDLDDRKYMELKKNQDKLDRELLILVDDLEYQKQQYKGWEEKRKKLKLVEPDRYSEFKVF